MLLSLQINDLLYLAFRVLYTCETDWDGLLLLYEEKENALPSLSIGIGIRSWKCLSFSRRADSLQSDKIALCEIK
jgi:hypothetical protein